MRHNSDMCAIRAVVERLSVAALLLGLPVSALTQVIPNNSLSATIQNNAAMQSNLTQQMINSMNGRPASSYKPVCFPPFELQRGPAGRIPPQSQGDPRYLEYVRCRYGEVTPQTLAIAASQTPLPVPPAAAGSASVAQALRPPADPQAMLAAPPGAGSGPSTPGFPAGQHLPLGETDFVPVQPGHPVWEQQLAQPMPPVQRAVMRNVVNDTFNQVAVKFRANNLAVSMAVAYSTAAAAVNGLPPGPEQTRELVLNVNDSLVQGSQFARMSAVEKQNASDFWIFETAMIRLLQDAGQRGDVQAAQQAVGLSRLVLQKLNGP